MVRKYGIDKVIPQFHMKWITKLSFVLKITQFLVSELFVFISEQKSEFTKTFCMLFICAVKPN